MFAGEKEAKTQMKMFALQNNCVCVDKSFSKPFSQTKVNSAFIGDCWSLRNNQWILQSELCWEEIEEKINTNLMSVRWEPGG